MGGLLSLEEIQAVLGVGDPAAPEAGDGSSSYTRRLSSELHAATARFGQFLESSLRQLLLLPVVVTVVRSAERQGAPGGSSMSLIFQIVQVGDFGLLSVDANLIDALLCSVFGTTRLRAGPSRYSVVEQALIKRALDVALADLGRALRSWTNLDFIAGRIETGPSGPNAASLAPHAFEASLHLSLGGRAGVLKVTLPAGL